MNFKYVYYTLFIFFSLNVFSQNKNYTDGFVIVNDSRDTIFGKLKNMVVQRSCWKLKFIDQNGNNVKFKPKDVYAYKRGDEVYFTKKYERPMSIGNRLAYMKLIVDGKVRLFQFKYETQNGNMFVGGLSDNASNYYLENNNKFLLVKPIGFKKKMAAFFSDDASLVKKISSRKLKYDQLEEIVKIYNKNHQ